jgi:hypothetical protein
MTSHSRHLPAPFYPVWTAPILDVLTEYERSHQQAQIEGRRHNPVSISLRILAPDFQGMYRIAREPEIWKLLSKLPEEVFVNITRYRADALQHHISASPQQNISFS